MSAKKLYLYMANPRTFTTLFYHNYYKVGTALRPLHPEYCTP